MPRNLTTYTARFSRLRLHAFGIQQVLEYETEVEIYQARVSPELWRARPVFSKGGHKWEAASAELLMDLIAADFEEQKKSWKPWQNAGGDTNGPLLLVTRPIEHNRKAG